jgi:hypothetical protein
MEFENSMIHLVIEFFELTLIKPNDNKKRQ